jgi:hypothetical protein
VINSWLVVLTWNGRDDTLELLDSLTRANLTNTTVLVVDNASADGTLDEVRAAHPWVRTLQTGSNLGYAGGNNRGVELALSEGAEVIGVLNNDTLVAEDFWDPLVSVALRGDTAVCPDIRYADAPSESWFFGATFAQDIGVARHLRADEQPPRIGLPPSDLLTGCCLVASAQTWRAVGGFDEGMFLIFEDSDWSMRARTRRVQLVLQPASRIEHKVSRSFQGLQSGLGLYYYSRNGAVFAHRWFGARATARFAVRTVLAEGIRELRRDRIAAIRPLLLRCMALLAASARRRGPAGLLVRAIALSRRRRPNS